ncbi:MAG: DUF2927 domain-containing protein [Clostridia bacterium]|nr:DUF2927 domain-containing protein [Clostridia bacterium]
MRSREKWLSLLFSLFLFFSFTAHADTPFRFSDEKTASRKALELFHLCAFFPEYGPPEEQTLIRWEEEIRIWAGGSPTREDLRVLDGFIAELSEKVPDLPAIRRVRQDTQSNVRFWFVPGYMLPLYIEGYVDGNWGFFHTLHPAGRILSARIGIATDLTEQEDRNHLILEELVGALGLPGDHTLYTDSILYDGWTTTFSLSEVDWRMLNMLYHPSLRPGMTWPEAQQALHSALGL